MFNFIRNLVFYTVVIIAIASGFVLFFYGTVEPCRILANQMSTNTIEGVNDMLGGGSDTLSDGADETVESIFRAVTSQYTTGRCMQDVGQTWWQDLQAW